jgi:hypothetical protein
MKSHPGFESTEWVLDRLATHAHGVWRPVQPVLRGIDDRLVIPESQTIILWFDQGGHPVVPTCALPGRRARGGPGSPKGHRAVARREASWTATSTAPLSAQMDDDNAVGRP